MPSKRVRQFREEVKAGVVYSIKDAVQVLKKYASKKFDETMELVFNLGVDPRKADQIVRGSCVLPNGTGKTLRIAVIAQGPQADAATQAGADIVGFEDLAQKIKGGFTDFDLLIATPDSMKLVGQLGPILGPVGLMPSPKDGTVTQEVAGTIRNARSGIRYRTEKTGILHCIVGKSSFDDAKLEENIIYLLQHIKREKPATAKGVYMKKVFLSSTMGPGIQIDTSVVA